MSIRTKKFKAGNVQINLMVDEPIKLLIMFQLDIPPPKLTCGGGEVLVTRSKEFSGCNSDGTMSSNQCTEAFNQDQFWMPKEDPAFMDIEFYNLIQPTRIVYNSNPLTGIKPVVIKVY